MDASRRSMLRRAALSIPPVRRLITQRDEARARAKKLEKQLQALGARSGPGLGYVFVVTYGRSGSTLLQGILSSIPGYLIRGENGDALYSLYKFHSKLEKVRASHGKGRRLPVTSPWFGIDGYPSDRAVTQIRQLALTTLLRPEADTRVVGYKEIRWWHDDWREYLVFLQAVFPGAKFVINTRDRQDVSASKWWADRDPDTVTATLDKYERILDGVAGELGSGAYRVHYNDYVADPSTLRGLFDWLGEPFDEARVRDVMNTRHSY